MGLGPTAMHLNWEIWGFGGLGPTAMHLNWEIWGIW